jgi:hypothetical protein
VGRLVEARRDVSRDTQGGRPGPRPRRRGATLRGGRSDAACVVCCAVLCCGVGGDVLAWCAVRDNSFVIRCRGPTGGARVAAALQTATFINRPTIQRRIDHDDADKKARGS